MPGQLLRPHSGYSHLTSRSRRRPVVPSAVALAASPRPRPCSRGRIRRRRDGAQPDVGGQASRCSRLRRPIGRSRSSVPAAAHNAVGQRCAQLGGERPPSITCFGSSPAKRMLRSPARHPAPDAEPGHRSSEVGCGIVRQPAHLDAAARGDLDDAVAVPQRGAESPAMASRRSFRSASAARAGRHRSASGVERPGQAPRRRSVRAAAVMPPGLRAQAARSAVDVVAPRVPEPARRAASRRCAIARARRRVLGEQEGAHARIGQIRPRARGYYTMSSRSGHRGVGSSP